MDEERLLPSLVFLHAAGRALFPSQCTPHPPSILSTTTMTTTCDDARVDQQAMSPSTSSCMFPSSSSGSQPLSAPLLAYFLRLQTCLTSQEGSLDAQQMLDLALLLIIQEHGAEACAGLGQTKTNTELATHQKKCRDEKKHAQKKNVARKSVDSKKSKLL